MVDENDDSGLHIEHLASHSSIGAMIGSGSSKLNSEAMYEAVDGDGPPQEEIEYITIIGADGKEVNFQIIGTERLKCGICARVRFLFNKFNAILHLTKDHANTIIFYASLIEFLFPK